MGSNNTADPSDVPLPDGDGESLPIHLFGDVHYVNRYPRLWWVLAGVMCLLVPPIGAAALGWLVVGGIELSPDGTVPDPNE